MTSQQPQRNNKLTNFNQLAQECVSAQNGVIRIGFHSPFGQMAISGIIGEKRSEAGGREDACGAGEAVAGKGVVRGEPSAQRMRRISEREGGYKRSTNNSHKKFICVAKRLLLRLLAEPRRAQFEGGFDRLKNSRTYFFVILAHALHFLAPSELHVFRTQFVGLMRAKIDLYRKEVARTSNRNFITFRCDEIADIEYAISAMELYFMGRVEAAVETLYKRDRAEVLKRHQFEQAIETVLALEEALTRSSEGGGVQDVIVLQSHAEALPVSQEERSTILQPGLQNGLQQTCFQQTKPLPPLPFAGQNSSFIRPNRVMPPETVGRTPLLFLEGSYPYYDYFWEIMFPYEAQANALHAQHLTYMESCLNYALSLPPQRALESWEEADGKRKEEMCAVGRTAVEEEAIGG